MWVAQSSCGEFKPDGQRIPAGMWVSASVKFSQDKGQLHRVAWEEWGEGLAKWSLKSFHRSHMMEMARPTGNLAGPALCLPSTRISEAPPPPWHAWAVYFNPCLWLNIDHNASLHDVSWNGNSAVTSEKCLWPSFAEELIIRWFTSLEDEWLVWHHILSIEGSENPWFNESASGQQPATQHPAPSRR